MNEKDELNEFIDGVALMAESIAVAGSLGAIVPPNSLTGLSRIRRALKVSGAIEKGDFALEIKNFLIVRLSK